jgi:hypothetical protein
MKMSGNKFFVKSDHRSLLGFFKKDSENDSVREKRLNGWKKVMNLFTGAMRYLPGVEIANIGFALRAPQTEKPCS